MSFRVALSALTFSDGSRVPVPEHGVTALVGPNNAGKTAALRDVYQLLSATPAEGYQPRVVPSIEVTKDGTNDDLIAWLHEHAFRTVRQDGPYYSRAMVGGMREENLLSQWGLPNTLGSMGLAAFLVFYGQADSRLGLASGGASHYDPVGDSPNHPLQVLFARPDLEEQISDTAREAFGTELHLTRAAGAALDLRLGTPRVAPDTTRPTPEYIQALRELPLLQEQGDGMRSFIGIMLSLTAAFFPIVIIDEPEAFLHPPQARLLGRLLASGSSGSQVILATHSSDILQGLVETAHDNVVIARLVREGDRNPISVLEASDLSSVWRDPLLRYSRVLDGIFHRGTVVCESDTDAAFYAAVLDSATGSEREAHDLLFTHSSGKARIPALVQALRALDVPVAVIADMDVLREKDLLMRILQALGTEWNATLDTEWNVMTSAIVGLGHEPLVSEVRERISSILAAATERISRDDAREIRNAVTVEDGWRHVKRGGRESIPQGDASVAAGRLLDSLAANRLFVVDVGELERWAPSIVGHGPAWLSGVLESRLHEGESFQARPFVERVAAALGAAA